MSPRGFLGDRERVRGRAEDESRQDAEEGKPAHAFEIGVASRPPSLEWGILSLP
jgi:hypothetical protein